MHGMRKGLLVLLSEFISATLFEEEVIKLVGPSLTTCGENVSEQNKKVATGIIFVPF